MPVYFDKDNWQMDKVVLNDKPVKCDHGSFYLDYPLDGKRKQANVGAGPRAALDACRAKEAELNGEPIPEAEAVASADRRTPVSVAIDVFLTQVKATKTEGTLRAYETDLMWCKLHAQKPFVEDYTRVDIIKLMSEGRKDEKDFNQKTINRRAMLFLMAMRNAGAHIEMKKGDWPTTSDPSVTVYDRKDLHAFFKACEEEEKLLFQTFLCTGFRAREVTVSGLRPMKAFA